MKTRLKVNALWLGLFIAGYLLLYFLQFFGIMTPLYENVLVTVGINIILATGLNLVIGFSGQFSLGHAGFMAIGAYASALILLKIGTLGGLLLSLLVGMIVAGVAALIIGGPTLRLKGDYLAIATLGISEIIRIILINMKDVTNGAAGLFGIAPVVTWPIVYIFVILTTLVVVNFLHSGPGLATLAVREDEIASESVGLHATKYKIIAFVIGAMTASVAGGLYASYIQSIAPKDFTFNKSIDILIIVVFGGLGSITGSFVAAIVLGILNMVLQDFGQLRMIIYALALIAIMIFKPNGLLGKYEISLTRLFQKKKEVKL
ncbi:branched-chain amino acid ABC transporter permease [Enterococcus nangangensis]|uniref:branched-chain amino acid ABC transporter permease n=1 Tax=Enterococcus nangangensis TaxID=2559926 RepID=UPI0010F98C48|nr:branched-chain amino acid ABC transporter permease [Enterococcus nangangensis]